jgi:23S rRNA (uracil1939-C5)-methyltransferase
VSENQAELVVRELVAGGDGIATVEVDGERRAVLLRGAAPGDRVLAAFDLAKRPARGRVLELLERGPGRVSPPCPFTSACGGCDLMHVSADARAQLYTSLAAHAVASAWRDHPSPEPVHHAASSPLAYRVRARLHVLTTGRRVLVGMFAAGTNDPVSVDTCRALRPELDRLLPELPGLFEGANGKGELSLALGDPRVEPRPVVIDLHFSGDLPAATFARLDAWRAELGVAGARVLERTAREPMKIGDPTPWVVGADDAPLELGPGGFSQASEEGNRVLARRVAELARELTAGRPSPRATELFGGAGNLSVLLARELDKLTVVEGDREACDAARRNLAARDLSAKVVHADANDFALAKRLDLVVLDPPRTGAKALAERLPELRARAILIVSCDPATLARDLGPLADRYVPVAIETFDMFPQTSHVETVVALRERRA